MPKRNILVILCDQLRKDFLPIYGGKAIKTPNIDRIAMMGVVFDNAITVSSVCAPARASMMTGRYVTDHKVWTNDIPFRKGIDLLPERMNALGYQTACFGKLHHFPVNDTKGFQLAFQMEENRMHDEDHYLQHLKKRHPNVQNIFNVDNFQFAFNESDYYEYCIAENAISFMKSAKKPFFAWLSFQGPHTPYDPPKEVKGSVDENAIPKPILPVSPNSFPEVLRYRIANAQYYDAKPDLFKNQRIAYLEMIVEIDIQIGRVLDELEKNNQLENTTIIFSADHGDQLGDIFIAAKGPFPHSAQLEIPMIVANHPTLPKGKRSDCLTGNLDIPSTCLSIAEDQRPIGYSQSILGFLNGKPEREVNYSEFCDTVKTVENKHYRFSYYPFSGEQMLFDKINDPNCLIDLSKKKKYLEIISYMLKHIIDFQIIAKKVRIEAQDMTNSTRKGLERKNPNFIEDYDICFPLSEKQLSRIKDYGLDDSINDFTNARDIKRQYSLTKWQMKKIENGEKVQVGFPCSKKDNLI